MSDPNEPLDERVKRLEAEAAELRKKLAEVTEQRDNYRDAVLDDALKDWEGFTQADLDAAINNPVTLTSLIEQLERGMKHG